MRKRISPKICILSVRVKINKRSFEPFCVWIFQNENIRQLYVLNKKELNFCVRSTPLREDGVGAGEGGGLMTTVSKAMAESRLYATDKHRNTVTDTTLKP